MVNVYGRVFLSDMSGCEEIQHLMGNTLTCQVDVILISLSFAKLQEIEMYNLNIFLAVFIEE